MYSHTCIYRTSSNLYTHDSASLLPKTLQIYFKFVRANGTLWKLLQLWKLHGRKCIVNVTSCVEILCFGYVPFHVYEVKYIASAFSSVPAGVNKVHTSVNSHCQAVQRRVCKLSIVCLDGMVNITCH